MCVILQKLSLPLASLLLLFLSLSLSLVSVLLAIHLSFLSLLWITGTVLWESCPNTFVLPKQSITVSRSFAHFWFVCLSLQFRRSHSEVTRGPAGQLVLIASRGPFWFFVLFFFWGPPSQPGCSDARRAGHQPSGNIQAATHRGNRRTAQTHTVPSHLLCTDVQMQTHTCREPQTLYGSSIRYFTTVKVVKTVIRVCALTPQATHKETQGGGG